MCAAPGRPTPKIPFESEEPVSYSFPSAANSRNRRPAAQIASVPFNCVTFSPFAVLTFTVASSTAYDPRTTRPLNTVEAHKAKVTVYVPVYAMSGGTLIALAADEIVLGEFSVLGPIDPQIAGLPAASIVKARDSKPVEGVFDLTLVLADVAEKALAQVKQGAVELLTPRMERSAAEALAAKLAGGHWTHDYALTAHEARALGLPVKVGIPPEVMQLMSLYPQPIQRSGVEYLPIEMPRQRQV